MIEINASINSNLCLISAANGHSDCLRMMIDYGEEGDLTNVADKFGQ